MRSKYLLCKIVISERHEYIIDMVKIVYPPQHTMVWWMEQGKFLFFRLYQYFGKSVVTKLQIREL